MSEHEDFWGDFGLLQHLDKTDTPCAYCEKPSVQTFDATKVRGPLDVRVGLCVDHQREPEEPWKDGRRSPARGVEQIAMDIDA